MILTDTFSPRVRGSRLASFGLTAASGAALVLGVAPWSWSALAPLPMAVLFYQVRGESMRQALARGYVFGLGLFGAGIAWIHVAVLQFGAGLLVAVPASATLVMLVSVFPAAALALAAWASPPISTASSSSRFIYPVIPTNPSALDWMARAREDAVFSSDVLLIRGSGRTDFQGGDPYKSCDSIAHLWREKHAKPAGTNLSRART